MLGFVVTAIPLENVRPIASISIEGRRRRPLCGLEPIVGYRTRSTWRTRKNLWELWYVHRCRNGSARGGTTFGVSFLEFVDAVSTPARVPDPVFDAGRKYSDQPVVSPTQLVDWR